MELKRLLFLICGSIIFLVSLLPFCAASEPTIVYLHTSLSVGSITPALATSTINSPLYDIPRQFETLYTYVGSGTLYYRYDGGTVTVGTGHALSNLGNIIVDKIGQARNMQLLCDIGIGTVTITYMRVMP